MSLENCSDAEPRHLHTHDSEVNGNTMVYMNVFVTAKEVGGIMYQAFKRLWNVVIIKRDISDAD